MKRIKGMQSILNKNCNSHSRNFHLNSIRPAKHLDTEVTVTSTQSNHDSTSTSTAPIDYSDILRGNQEEREAALHQLRNQPAYLARYRSLDPSSRSGTGKGRLSAADGGHATATATAGRSHQSQAINGHSFNSTINHASTSYPSRSSPPPPTAKPTNPITSTTQPKRSTPSNPSSIRSSSSSSHSNSTQRPTEKEKEDWAFGGGESSRGGPVTAQDFFEQQQEALSNENNAQSGVIGSAGKGAVPGYGKKKKQALPEHKFLGRNSFDEVLSLKDLELARNYRHEYAPTTRSARPLAQHTYFTSPSSSYNATSHVAPGTSGPLGRSGSSSGVAKRKKTVLVSPGQGSQFVAMSRDLYKAFRSARTTWHAAEEALLYTPNLSGHSSSPTSLTDRAHTAAQREAFENELARSYHLDSKRGFAASGTAVVRGRRGYLRDIVFSGDQLDLTRSENAQPSILTSTISFLNVLRKEFNVDLISEHVSWSAGHGSGTYASLVASGSIDFSDALRLLRHRGLIASHHVANHPILFPEGCIPPESVYETWAFANAGNGKGADLVDEMMDTGGVPITNSTTDGQVVKNEVEMQKGIAGGANGSVHEGLSAKRSWRRSQMSGFMVRAGKLNEVLSEVAKISQEIKSDQIPGVSTDEVVEIANINSQLQVVLSGTRVGVSLSCDRLRNLGLGARAVNLPVSGPYHTSLMAGAAEALYPMVEHMPLSDPSENMGLISSVDGKVLRTENDIRQDLYGALTKPVRWLDSIDTMVENGIERFICLGPGRACAHLLSKELALRDKNRGKDEGGKREFEVWSIATVEDVEQLGSVLSRISESEGATRQHEQFSDDVMAL